MIETASDIDDIQASLMRTLASANRLRILHRLSDGPMDVTEIARALSIPQPVASQHLAAMRAAGVVESQRDGRCVRYALVDPGIVAACGLMRQVLIRRLARLGDLAAAAAGAAVPTGPASLSDTAPVVANTSLEVPST